MTAPIRVFAAVACLAAGAFPALAGSPADAELLAVVRRGYERMAAPPCRYRMVTTDETGAVADSYVEVIGTVDGRVVSRIDETASGGPVTLDDGVTRRVWLAGGGPVFELPAVTGEGACGGAEMFALLEPLIRDIRTVEVDGRPAVEVVFEIPVDQTAGEPGPLPPLLWPACHYRQAVRFERGTSHPIDGRVIPFRRASVAEGLCGLTLGFDPFPVVAGPLPAGMTYRFEDFETAPDFAADEFVAPADREVVVLGSETRLAEELERLR